MNEEIIQYETSGVCCAVMQVKVCDGVIKDAVFHGGCNGNLKGIRALITGMKIDDVISRLKGIECREKGTSCPDQLAKCLLAYKNKEIKALQLSEQNS